MFLIILLSFSVTLATVVTAHSFFSKNKGAVKKFEESFAAVFIDENNERAKRIVDIGQMLLKNAGITNGKCLYANTPQKYGSEGLSMVGYGSDPDLICYTDKINPRTLEPMYTEKEVEGLLAHETAHLLKGPLGRLECVLVDFIIIWCFVFLFITLGGILLFKASSVLEVLLFVVVLMPVGMTMLEIILLCLATCVMRMAEYKADAVGLTLTRYPKDFIKLFRKIEKLEKQYTPNITNMAEVAKWATRGSWINRALATHPPIRKRIRRLCKQYRKMSLDNARDKQKKRPR